MSSEFTIKFERAGQGYSLTVDGNRVGVFQPPPPHPVASLQRLADGYQSEQDIAEANAALEALGQGLFQHLFTANLSLSQLFRSLPSETPLVLHFDESSSVLLSLPWEFLSEQGKHPERVAAFRPLIRRFGAIREFYPVEGRPLRLLVVISEPLTLEQFNGRDCHDKLLGILSPLVYKGFLELSFLPRPATPNAFSSYLTEHSCDIIHFIGHGSRGGLVLETDCGGSFSVDADRLCILLGGKKINLAVLTACQSASIVGDDPLSGTATSLLFAGIPAVVAMQFSALAEPAFLFMEDLYRALVGEGKRTLAQAVREARVNRYFSADSISAYQWGVPALYSQAPDSSPFVSVVKGEPKKLFSWPPPQGNHNIPKEDKPFLGRGGKMVEVNQALKGHHIVVLEGEGGIGKSALVHQVALWHIERGTFPGGSAFVSLETPKSRDIVFEEIGRALWGAGFQFPPGDRLTYLKERLSDNPALVILDNFETVHKDLELIRTVQELSQFSFILITTRISLSIGSHLKVDELDPEASVDLFYRLATDKGWVGEGTEAERAKIKKICNEGLGNMPLAIELVAPQAKALSLSVIEKQIEKGLDAIASERPDLPPRQQSILASQELSYNLLSTDEAKKLYARLSVFPGGVTPDIVKPNVIVTVCEISNWQAPIQELVGKNLVGMLASGDFIRYSMHPLVRRYGEEVVLERSGERQKYKAKFAEFLISLASQASGFIVSKEVSRDKVHAVLYFFALERENILSALFWLNEQKRWGDVIAFAFALNEPFDRMGLWADWAYALRLAIVSAESKQDKKALSKMKHNLGIVEHNQGNYPIAEKLYQESLKIKEELGDKSLIASSLHQLGIIKQDQDDYAEAEKLYRESLRLAEECGDKFCFASSLHHLGMIKQIQGDYAEAEKLYRESLKIRSDIGDKSGTAASFGQLGIIKQDQGDYVEAEKLYRECLRLAEELGIKLRISNSLHQLGIIKQYQGDYAEAEKLYRASLRIAEELENKSGIAHSLLQLGSIRQEQGDYLGAERLYQESLRIASELGEKSGIAQSLYHLGINKQHQGDYAEAEKLYRESLRLAEVLGIKLGISNSLHQLGIIKQHQGDYAEAEKFYRESLRIAEELGDKSGIAASTGQLGLLFEEQGNDEEALKCHVTAHLMFKRLGSPEAEKVGGFIARMRNRLGEESFQSLLKKVLSDQTPPSDDRQDS